MKLIPRVMVVACLALFSVVAFAQPPASPCNPCVTYCSFTQGGWGVACQGGNAGCLRDQCFDAVYPNGLTIGQEYPGGCCWIHFTSSMAIEDFLPQGSQPMALGQNYTDPGAGNITEFAGQVLALQLNVDLGAYGCGSMVDISGLEIATGPFEGWTVQQLLDAANIALGGGALPPGVTIPQINEALNAVNNNFDNCVDNDGYIAIPPQGETVIARDYNQELPVSFCLDFTEQCGDLCIMWWCNFCQPGDFAHFYACPDGGEVCPEDCNHLTSITWGEQQIIGPDPSGNGCWWYTTAHSDVAGCYCISFDFQLAADLIGDIQLTPANGQVRISWTTASERNSARFDIQRSTAGTWATIHSLPGQGTIASATNYSWVDENVTNDVTYSYRVISVDASGNVQPIGTVQSATPSTDASLPHEFALHQNYPNPFNPTTQIRFDIAEATHVNLVVFDINGRIVATLVDGNLAANTYEVAFDATGLSSGTYFYRLNAGSFSAMQKMLVLK